MRKVIFWDFDGTLSYPNKSFFTALYTALRECGYDTDMNETAAYLEKVYSWKSPQIDYTDKCNELWWDTLFLQNKRFLHFKKCFGGGFKKGMRKIS